MRAKRKRRDQPAFRVTGQMSPEFVFAPHSIPSDRLQDIVSLGTVSLSGFTSTLNTILRDHESRISDVEEIIDTLSEELATSRRLLEQTYLELIQLGGNL